MDNTNRNEFLFSSKRPEGSDTDIVSGSRYLKKFSEDTAPPEQRRAINQTVTAELNELLCLDLTDAFCGFKAYKVDVLNQTEAQRTGLRDAA